ncbi:hypothetical protein [Sunxiuqinia elliptica]|uniref:Uncharacterized protein n=1 Tax=Sunxiuqinia elliptica TaxID=655355 RepID=A0A1I2K1S4_9BACT|nr:hypothetical protein [Sunxiuqinia elliptica]SFF60814.1 hypothetical protein SAMN05216283_110137 [Sunxiuqinia elliptica]
MSFDERIEKPGELKRGWAGLMLSVWQASKTNSLNWTIGYETDSVIAFGTTGKNRNGKGKT